MQDHGPPEERDTTTDDVEGGSETVRRGFGNVWRVCRTYGVRDGRIRIEDDQLVKVYGPGGCHEVVTEFGNLEMGDVQGLLGFTHRWGLLGQARLEAALPLDWSEPEEVDWAFAHVNGVKLCLGVATALSEFRQLVKRGRYAKAEIALRTAVAVAVAAAEGGPDPIAQRLAPNSFGLRRGAGATSSYWIPTRLKLLRGPNGVELGALGPQLSPDEILELAAELTNPNLAGIRTELVSARMARGVTDPLEPRKQVLGLVEVKRFRALIEVIWWHVGQALIGAGSIARCNECNRMFVRVHGSQKYCPPANGGSESSCAKLHVRAKGKNR